MFEQNMEYHVELCYNKLVKFNLDLFDKDDACVAVFFYFYLAFGDDFSKKNDSRYG